jgi:hypothetical protein
VAGAAEVDDGYCGHDFIIGCVLVVVVNGGG